MIDLRSARPSDHVWGRESLGSLVRQRAQQLGLPLTTVAARTGVTRAYLHRLLSGETKNPGVSTIHRLATALELPAMTLFRLYTNGQAGHVSPRTARRHLGLLDPCDGFVFVEDVTVPDHSPVCPRERFTKTWAIQNAGSVIWLGRRLVRVDSDVIAAQRTAHGNLVPILDTHLMSYDRIVEIPTTQPGQVTELSVELRAPDGSGAVAAFWTMEDSDGRQCFDYQCHLYCIVTVVGA